jgi:hypothetical protein
VRRGRWPTSAVNPSHSSRIINNYMHIFFEVTVSPTREFVVKVESGAKGSAAFCQFDARSPSRPGVWPPHCHEHWSVPECPREKHLNALSSSFSSSSSPKSPCKTGNKNKEEGESGQRIFHTTSETRAPPLD